MKILQIAKANIGIISMAILIVVLLKLGCSKKQPVVPEIPYTKEYVDSLKKEIAIEKALNAESRKRIANSDSAIKDLKEAKLISDAKYAALSRKERIRRLESSVGGTVTTTDSLTCLNDTQMDSVNAIVAEKNLCESILQECSNQNQEYRLMDSRSVNMINNLTLALDTTEVALVASKDVIQYKDKEIHKLSTKNKRKGKWLKTLIGVVIAETGYILITR